MLHDWYRSEYDSMLATMFRENIKLQALHDSNSCYQRRKLPPGCSTTRNARNVEELKHWAPKQDRSVMKDDWRMTYRVQTSIMRVQQGYQPV